MIVLCSSMPSDIILSFPILVRNYISSLKPYPYKKYVYHINHINVEFGVMSKRKK